MARASFTQSFLVVRFVCGNTGLGKSKLVVPALGELVHDGASPGMCSHAGLNRGPYGY